MKSNKLKKIIAIAIASAIVSSVAPVTASAAWLKDSQNNWSWTESGSKSTGWKQINGAWYNFDADGKMQTGWIKGTDGKWYDLAPSGEMKTGWVRDTDGKWYNLAPSGEMRTGWVQDTDGKWYNLASSGEMKTGWIQNADGKWYFANSSGAMQTGVVEVQGKVYVLDNSGAMAVGTTEVNGQTYTTDASGAITGDKLPKADKAFTNGGSATTPNTTSNTNTNATGTTAETTTTGGSSSSSSSNSSSSSSSSSSSTNNTNTTTVTSLADLSDGGIHTGSYTISNAGTFGGNSTTTINGNISISDTAAIAGETITLQKLNINGDITIDFGAGNVILDNVTVKGVNVSNVGSHSLEFIDSSAANLNVNDKDNDAHILVKGNSSIVSTAVYSGASLEVASDATGISPFDRVIIAPSATPSSDNLISLSGQFRSVEIERPSFVAVQGSIGTMSVAQAAPSTQIQMSDPNASVGTLNAAAPIAVSGLGNIQAANLGVSGTNISIPVGTTSVTSGVTVTVGTSQISENHGATLIDSVPTYSPQVLDKTALANKIKEASNAINDFFPSIAEDGSDISSDSKWVSGTAYSALEKAMITARNKAILATTQDEVTVATNALNSAVTAYNNAEKKYGLVDKYGLLKALDYMIPEYNNAIEGTNPGQYESGSKVIFKRAIDVAQVVLDKVNKTQAEVNTAIEALQKAESEFVSKVVKPAGDNESPVLPQPGYLTQHDAATTSSEVTLTWNKATDTTTPQSELKYSLYVSGNRPDWNNMEEWKKTAKLLTQGKGIDTFTVKELDDTLDYYFQLIVEDAAGNKTQYATEHREPRTAATVDKKALTDAISDAIGVATDLVVGQENGNYAQADIDIFKTAIADAQKVVDNANATPNEIEKAYEALKEAEEVFYKSTITGLLADVGSVTENENFHQTIQVKIEGYGDFVGTLNKDDDIALGGDFVGLNINSVTIDPNDDYKANVELIGDLKKSTGIGTITINQSGWRESSNNVDRTCRINVGSASSIDFIPNNMASFIANGNQLTINVGGNLTGDIDTSKLIYMTSESNGNSFRLSGNYSKVNFTANQSAGTYFYLNGGDGDTIVYIKLTDSDAAAIKNLDNYGSDSSYVVESTDRLVAENGWYPGANIGAKAVSISNNVNLNNQSAHNIRSNHFFDKNGREIGSNGFVLKNNEQNSILMNSQVKYIVFADTQEYIPNINPSSGYMKIVEVNQYTIANGITLDNSGWVEINESNFGPTPTNNGGSPVLVGNGILTQHDETTPGSLTLTWDKATDDNTPQRELKYSLYIKEAKIYNTIEEWELNADKKLTEANDINSFEVTGLNDTSDYYFKLIVEDADGNKTAYTTEHRLPVRATGLVSTQAVAENANFDQTIQVEIDGDGDFIQGLNAGNIKLGGDFEGLNIKSVTRDVYTYKANIELVGVLKSTTGVGTITVNGAGWMGLSQTYDMTCSVKVTTSAQVDEGLYCVPNLDSTHKVITLTFNKNIINNTSSNDALKNLITISTSKGSESYDALGENDTVEVNGKVLKITFAQELPVGANWIFLKVDKNALKDEAGNVWGSNYEVTSDLNPNSNIYHGLNITVKGTQAIQDYNNSGVYNVLLPNGTNLIELTANYIEVGVGASSNTSTIGTTKTSDGGKTWTVDLTAEGGPTVTYTINVTVAETAATLADAKIAAHTALANALANYNMHSNYTGENWGILAGLKTNGDTAIDAAIDVAGVTLAQTTAINGMAGVATVV